MVDLRPIADMPVAPPSPLPTSESADEEELECRVCRGEAEPGRRLYAPCKCSGSIRFTHSDCLEQWLEHSGKSFCELCGHEFTFTPLYDANAPDVLPWKELVTTGLRVVLLKWLPFAVRSALVVVLWLAVAPWCTSWLYRMWLLRASAMINVNFSERFDASHIVMDIFAGVILILCIVFSFLALMSFADFLRFHLDHIEEVVADDEALHHHLHPHRHDVAQHMRRAHIEDNNHVDGVIENEQAERQLRPLLEAPRRLGNLDDNVESDDSSDEEEWVDPNRIDPFADALIQQQDVGLLQRVEDADPVLQPQHELRQRRPLREVEDERGRPAIEPPRAARQRVDPPANMNQREWEDDFEHMEINIAMDELLGLRGDLIVLFRNVSWLLAFNGAYLGLFAFIPYTLGSTLLSAGARIATSLPVTSSAYSVLVTLESMPEQDLSTGAFFVKMLLQSIETAKEQGDCLQLVDICTCAMGYLSICMTIVLWRFMVRTASSYIHRPLMDGLLWALRCLTAIVKVSTLLLLKMVIVPILLGLCIDFASLRLFMATAQDRIAFCMQNIICALMVHWVLGITFMLFVTVSVLQTREVAHPEVLAKLIRPQEDHPDLLRTLLSESCMKHARRMILSLVIYAALLLVLVHIPVRIAGHLAPSYFPLTLRFQHYSPEIQVPLELLVVHLVVLSVLEHAKNDIGKIQHVGMVFASKWLGLTEYLLPQTTLEIDVNGQRQSNVVILPPPPLHFHPRAQLPPKELRAQGNRYLPWPEDGVDDPQLLEYPLLPRVRPSYLWLRLAGLAVFTWAVCIVIIGTFLFGSFFVGRICMGPFERVSGISHDPLVMATGVQIVWYFVNSVHAFNILMLPENRVDPVLIERGYTVRNRSPGNAIFCAVGWAFVCPYLLGQLMSACVASANTTSLESFLNGYLVLNLFTWLVCCLRPKRANRRRNLRRAVPEAFENDEMDVDNEDEFFNDDREDEELEEEEEERLRHEEGVVGVAPESMGLVASIRRVFCQVQFNVTVHENVGVRLRRDNIRDKCFDVKFFRQNVLQPIAGFLVGMLVVPWLLSNLLFVVFSGATSFEETLFAICAFWVGTAFVLVRSHSQVTRWLSNLSESIRNERYLIGRQLQDMTR